MPNINISTALYNKLKGLAEPFVDTPESVMERCVDFYASSRGKAAQAVDTADTGDQSVMMFPEDGAPDLTFSRPISIDLGGVKFEKKDLYWNTLLYEVVRVASRKFRTADDLRRSILVNFVDGEGPAEKGYRYIEEAGLSVQGQDANAAWRAAIHLIKTANMTVDVVFRWENKEGVAHPGKTGQMKYRL
jgi:hypothetical protein